MSATNLGRIAAHRDRVKEGAVEGTGELTGGMPVAISLATPAIVPASG
jgi:hypothetical protein